jgi:hypothetical protein
LIPFILSPVILSHDNLEGIAHQPEYLQGVARWAREVSNDGVAKDQRG